MQPPLSTTQHHQHHDYRRHRMVTPSYHGGSGLPQSSHRLYATDDHHSRLRVHADHFPMPQHPSVSPVAFQAYARYQRSPPMEACTPPSALPTMSSMLTNQWSTSPSWQPAISTQHHQFHESHVASPPMRPRSIWTDPRSPIPMDAHSRPLLSLAKASLDASTSPSNHSDSTISVSQPPNEDTPRANNTPTSPDPSDRNKASRYLREMDRRAILERLARGEKQATLAKEYSVSRAAICNLFKHRHEVMSRTDEDPFAKHPKKRKNKRTTKSRRSRSLKLASGVPTKANSSSVCTVVSSSPSSTHVHQLQTDAVLLLLTVMADNRASADEFRRSSERLVWLLMEEALASVPIQSMPFFLPDDTTTGMGVATEHPPCGVSLEQHASPMLDVFQLLEPDRPVGRIAPLDVSDDTVVLHATQLPSTLKYHNVFVLDIAIVSPDVLRVAIERVKQQGALEVMIYVVALFVSADVVEMVQQEYPHLRIVTTQIESHFMEREKCRRSCVDVVLGRFDRIYHTQYTVV